MGVAVFSFTLDQVLENGSMLSRASEKLVLVAQVMLASRQESIATKAMTCSRSAAQPPKWLEKMATIGLAVPLTVAFRSPGIAIANTAKTMKATAPEMVTARSMARGAMRRGSVVSSARSAEPSQPASVHTGSSSARPMVSKPAPAPVDEPVWVSTCGPWTWWKKNSPMASAIVAPIVPTSSMDAPALLTRLAALIDVTLMMTATMIATTASTAMSQCVGLAQMSGANTEARETEMPAEPTRVQSIAFQPVNQP